MKLRHLVSGESGIWIKPPPVPAQARKLLAVITFMRNRWDNQAPAVSATQVATLRKNTNRTSDQAIVLKMR